MSPAKTAAERKADERQRHKEAGRTAVTVHVRPEYVPEVRALEAKLQGRVNKAGTAFVGVKQDVTSDVLRAVIEKAEFHGGTFEIEGGDKKWTVTVSAQPAGEGEK